MLRLVGDPPRSESTLRYAVILAIPQSGSAVATRSLQAIASSALSLALSHFISSQNWRHAFFSAGDICFGGSPIGAFFGSGRCLNLAGSCAVRPVASAIASGVLGLGMVCAPFKSSTGSQAGASTRPPPDLIRAPRAPQSRSQIGAQAPWLRLSAAFVGPRPYSSPSFEPHLCWKNICPALPDADPHVCESRECE